MTRTLISVTDAASRLNTHDTAFVDCRASLFDHALGRQQYLEAHIPGAHFADMESDLCGTIIPGETGRHPLPERDALTATFNRWGIGPQTLLIAYDDHGGGLAARLWWLSRWLGHAEVAVLDGGLEAWRAADLKLDAEPPADTLGQFSSGVPLEVVTTLEQVRQCVQGEPDASLCLIDAREHERWRGEQEPIDPVAGHIPGALNFPFKGNLDSKGCFDSPASLKARFASLDEDARPRVHYCGSGVTAAHNILAMRHAGMNPGALYAGSFSEWITRDGERYPVARQNG